MADSILHECVEQYDDRNAFLLVALGTISYSEHLAAALPALAAGLAADEKLFDVLLGLVALARGATEVLMTERLRVPAAAPSPVSDSAAIPLRRLLA